ncbi:hypothetical protein FBU30_001353 [Linnemannia zychae]|nr:hypothetical protein FBU30_001353 [Linnemannia zychae]
MPSVASSSTNRPKAPFKSLPPLTTTPTPLNNTPSYKELVAQFTAKAPQPYGVIPPRRKRANGPGLARSSSTSSLPVIPKKSRSNKNNSGSLPPSPTETVGNSVELLPTQLSKSMTSNNSIPCDNNAVNTTITTEKQQIIQPLFHSLQSFLPESASSSTRLGFWANLKAHYLAAKATSLSWSTLGSSNEARSDRSEGFSPSVALRLSVNSTSVAAVDATASQSASLTLTDMLLSLPNVAAPSTHTYRGSMNYPVSVAAMDRFKPIRTDTIPLKTFTYHETPVVERLPILTHIVKTPLRKTKDTTSTTVSPSSPSPLPTKDTKSILAGDKEGNSQDSSSLLPPLPRHLAARETRSNAAYLRMMAAELRMIRARKLISPLKPRGYLPRRKDPFQAGMIMKGALPFAKAMFVVAFT